MIQSAMRDNVKASLKETVGHYSIYDLVEKQNEVMGQVAEAKKAAGGIVNLPEAKH